jgi:hypothetical protein
MTNGLCRGPLFWPNSAMWALPQSDQSIRSLEFIHNVPAMPGMLVLWRCRPIPADLPRPTTTPATQREISTRCGRNKFL